MATVLENENDFSLKIAGSTDFQQELKLETNFKLRKTLPTGIAEVAFDLTGKAGTGIAFLDVEGKVSGQTTVTLFGIPVQARGGMTYSNLSNQSQLNANFGISVEHTFNVPGGEVGFRGDAEGRWDNLFNSRGESRWSGGVFIFGRIRFP